MTENANPLKRFYRQPQISIKLPSQEKYYTPDVVLKTATGEHPVLPMTSMDELALRTPDSLMSGQATVDVIKSCIPTIIDPWRLVNYDVDTVLLAIRIASYGETMDMDFSVPGTGEKMTQTINLPALLDTIRNQTIMDTCTLISGLTIKIKPLSYKQIADSQIKTFEQQRLYAQVSQSNLSDEEKAKQFTSGFKQLSELNTSLLVNNIDSIILPTGESVSDSAQIKDFINNANSTTVKELEEKLVDMRLQGSIKPLKIKATEDQIKAGVPATYEVPLTFDNSNFFV
jgi:hypothetical protein